MTEALAPFYLWFKALHIIAVIAWMAGMLYLPRLFVYHCEVRPGTAEYARFVMMEKRLMRIIVNPSMIAVWVFGILLATSMGAWAHLWLHAKLFLVVVLSGLHGMFSRWRRDFEQGKNIRPARFYRIVNEVPAVLMILIVLLVVLKPF
ncbi:MAG: protoporphyrinogen oxidase HemJ [Alphaproteobacteria bacterium]|nr:protoporphyrinogen oxidase HemJ [Alphaproteobacteria bacterium]